MISLNVKNRPSHKKAFWKMLQIWQEVTHITLLPCECCKIAQNTSGRLLLKFDIRWRQWEYTDLCIHLIFLIFIKNRLLTIKKQVFFKFQKQPLFWKKCGIHKETLEIESLCSLSFVFPVIFGTFFITAFSQNSRDGCFWIKIKLIFDVTKTSYKNESSFFTNISPCYLFSYFSFFFHRLLQWKPYN